MSTQPTGGGEKAQAESARVAIRAVGAAFKSLRMYPLGHALTTTALASAQRLLAVHAAAFGPLLVSVPARGLVLDAGPRPYEDDVTADLARALRARAAPAVRFLPGLTPGELGELLSALHLPIQQIDREGGLGKLLRERGVRNLIVEGTASAEPGTETGALLAALRRGAGDDAATALPGSTATAAQVAELMRRLDRSVVTWAKEEQAQAWRILSRALLTQQTPWQRGIVQMIVESTDEPWTAALAAEWSPAAFEGVAAPDAQARLGRLHVQPPAAPLPEIPAVPDGGADAAAALARWTPGAIRDHALGRLIEVLPVLDNRRLVECLDDVVEQSVVQLVEESDAAALISVLRAMIEAVRRAVDVRADLLRAALHRVMTLGGRELVARIVAEPVSAGHALVQAMDVAPAETVRALLELAGEEDRLAIRRSVVDLLSTLAAGRPEVLAEHVVDPRWPIARNAVSVLGRLGGPDILPYLRAAMEHEDGRVRREALRALAEVGTTEAVELLAAALYGGEGTLREAAAHWLGMVERPEAVEALAALFEETDLADDAEVKREAIRSLARLGGGRAVETLQLVLTRDAPLIRRRAADELRQEAAAALARMRGGT